MHMNPDFINSLGFFITHKSALLQAGSIGMSRAQRQRFLVENAIPKDLKLGRGRRDRRSRKLQSAAGDTEAQLTISRLTITNR